MSVQDEHELRARLSALLDGIEPRPAPVTRVVQRGRGIRMRRWISVAAGLAVIAAGAALIPGLLQTHRSAPIARLHKVTVNYKVTVTKLGPSAQHGVIAAGLTDGHRWQVRLSGPPGDPTVAATGMSQMATSTAPPPVGWPASLQEGSNGSRADAMISGIVSDRVTRLDISLRGGKVMSLTPASWGGHRWVAVVLPPDVRIVRAVAYAGARELAYSVPFGTLELATWWRPGQVPPRRLTKLIGTGRTSGIAWRFRAEIGPWGYCYTFNNGSDCIDSTSNPQLVPAGHVIAPMECGPLGGGNSPTAPMSGLVAAASNVRRVVLRYSDASTGTFPAAEAGRGWLVGYAIPAHLSVLSSVEYGAAGQVVGRTGALTWKCG
jgi:hypothetical protein